MPSRISNRRNWKFLVGLGTALSVGVLAMVVGNGPTAGSPAGAPEQRQGVGGIGPVLAGGTDVTLAQARNMTKLPMLLPQTSLASDSSIADVWVRNEGSDYVVVEYSSGVNVEIRPWPVADISPDDHWEDLMNDGIPGRIVDVDGQDVFVVPSSESAKALPPSWWVRRS